MNKSQTPPKSQTKKGPPQPKYDVGVLFVHGIGEQERGSTMVAFGEAIHDWMTRWFDGLHHRWGRSGISYQQTEAWFQTVIDKWETELSKGTLSAENAFTAADLVREEMRTKIILEHAGGGAGEKKFPTFEEFHKVVGSKTVVAGADFTDATVRGSSTAPPNADLNTLCVDIDGEIRTSKWLFAESWWARAFAAPSFREVVSWSRQVLPWTIGSHFGTRLRRAWNNKFKGPIGRIPFNLALLLFRIIHLIVGLLISPVVLVLLFLLLILAIPPIPSVRALVMRVQQTFAFFLGDSYVLVASPLQASAIVGQIQRDLAWMAEQNCKSIVLVAHSQGGAVTNLALRRGRPENLDLYITFGSGLRKLEELVQMTKPRRSARGVWAALLGIIIVAAGVLSYPSAEQARGTIIGTSLFALLVAFAGVIDLAGGGVLAKEELLKWSKRFAKWKEFVWEDYSATADPVPNGTLFDRDDKAPTPKAIKVHNRSSFLTDHTSYWENKDEFVSSVVRSIDGLLQGKCGHAFRLDAERERVMVERRKWRVRLIAGTRNLAWIAGIATIVTHIKQWGILAVWWFDKLAAWAGAILPGFGDGTAPTETTTGDKLPSPDFLGTVGALALIIVVYNVTYGFWTWWQRKNIDAFYLDKDWVINHVSFHLFIVFSLGLFAMGAWLAFPGWVGSIKLSGDWGGWIVLIVVGVIALIGVFLTVYTRPRQMSCLEPGTFKEVKIKANQYYNRTKVRLEKGAKYTFEVLGDPTWTDAFIKSSAEGDSRKGFLFRFFNRWLRLRDVKWFKLLGSIGLSDDTVFEIGAKLSNFEVANEGELVCFANDIPFFYWNNRGEITLKITRTA